MRRDAISAAWPLAIAARTVPAVLIPTGLAQLRVAKSAVFAEDLIVLNVFPTNFVALQRIESSVCLAPIISFWGATLGARAGPSRGHNRNFSPLARPSLRPRAANWQVACGIYLQGYRKSAAFCLIGEAFGRLVRLQLTMPV